MQQMLQQLLAMQEMAEANAKANQEDLLARMEAKIDVNQVKAAKQEEMLVKMNAKMDGNQAEMRSMLDEWLMGLKDGGKRQPPATKRQRLNPIQE
jgi:hypothetical protein